jgi:hypothetical protein
MLMVRVIFHNGDVRLEACDLRETWDEKINFSFLLRVSSGPLQNVGQLFMLIDDLMIFLK